MLHHGGGCVAMKASLTPAGRRGLFVLAVVAGALALPTTAALSGDITQLDTQVSLINVAVPTADPCVFDDVRVDVIDFVNHAQPTLLENYGLFVYDACNNTGLAGIGPLTF